MMSVLPAVVCVALAGCGGSLDYTIVDDPALPAVNDSDATSGTDATFDALAPDGGFAEATTTDAGNVTMMDVTAPPAPLDAATTPPTPPSSPPAAGCPGEVPAGATMCCGAVACVGGNCARRCNDCAATCAATCCAPPNKHDAVRCVVSADACQEND